MRKPPVILTSILLSVLLLSSCSIQSLMNPKKDSGASVSSESEEASETTAAATSGTSSEETESETEATTSETEALTPEPSQDEALWMLLDRITNFPSGTAGSSLKQAAISGELLDWAEDTLLTQEGIEEEILGYIASLDSNEQRDMFFFNYVNEDFRGTVSGLIAGNASAIGTVESAGYVLGHAAYTQEKWDAFDTALCTANDKYVEAYTGP